MRGVITIRDVWRCLASALRCRKTTFLDVAFPKDPT